MRRALLISTHFPADEQCVHGVFRRLDIHVEALCRVAEQVELLFLVGSGESFPPEVVEAHHRRLRGRWPGNVKLFVEPVVEPSKRQGRLDFVRGVFDFTAQALPSFPPGIHCEGARRAVLRALERAPGLVLAHRLGIMSLLASLPPGTVRAPVLFDLDDVEHRAHARRIWNSPEWPLQRLHMLHVPAILWAERRAARMSAATLVCSEEDRRHMQRVTGRQSFRVIRNAVPIPACAPSAGGPVAVFVGVLSYRPNAEAADLLAREIWPRVRARVPNAVLRIVGKRPENVRAYSRAPEGVSFLGFVADIESVYREARVVCCPITFGSGTRVKIVEAAAYGRAVVSTPIGAEGLEFEDGKEILLASDIPSFANTCVRLLQAPEEADRVGFAAHRKARELYGRDAVVDSLARIVQQCLLPEPGLPGLERRADVRIS